MLIKKPADIKSGGDHAERDLLEPAAIHDFGVCSG